MTREEYIELYEKCASGNCSEEDKLLLAEYKDDFILDSEWDLMKHGNKYEVTKRIFEKLEKSIHKSSAKRLNRLIRPLAAAVVLISLSLGFYFYLNTPKESATQLLEKIVKVTPDNTKAVLTLEDGSQLILDDSNNGILAHQGNTRITKEDNGKLKYDASSALNNNYVAKYNTISIPRGAEYQLLLPDGTKVWLNAESSLKFPVVFNGRERKVELSGEAYFEVAQNKEKPFRVLVEGMEIKVLGTHFNVNAYQSVNTTLIEGSVKLKSPDQEVLLKPGESGTKQEKGSFDVELADIEAVTAWKNGYFIFRDENIKSIMEKVARRYNVDVEYQGEIKNKEFYGKVSNQDNLPELLKNIELTGSVHFKIMPESLGKKRRVIVML